jgi:hypothetical protein
MSSKRRLAIVPPSRPADPARLRLNAAIKGAAKAKLALAEHQQAIRRAGEQLAESERQVEKARASVDAARHNFEGELAEAIAAGRAIPATSQVLGRADAAVAEAARTAEAVRAARDRLKADLRSVEVELRLADLDVLCKVNALTAPSVERLVVEAERASATLTRASAVLRYLTSLNMTGVGSSAPTAKSTTRRSQGSHGASGRRRGRRSRLSRRSWRRGLARLVSSRSSTCRPTSCSWSTSGARRGMCCGPTRMRRSRSCRTQLEKQIKEGSSGESRWARCRFSKRPP